MTNAGEDYVTETTFTVEGFGTQLANLACPKFACFDKDTPADWGDMIDPSPVRAIWHTVTRFSTFATVCAFDFLSDTNNYQAGIIEIEAQGMLDGINRVAERIMAQITFAPSGEWRLRRHASYLSTSDKTGLVTVASLTSRDMLDFTIDRPHLPRVGYVEGGALLYAPATKTYTFYTAKAPSIMNTSGEEIQQVNGLILKSTDVAGATNELSRVVGTHLSRMQNLYRLDVRLYDAWREIVPSNYDWYTFTIATSDNNRGISIGTGRYYLLESASWSVDVATGTLTVQAQFVQDVDAFGTAQDVARVPNVTPYPQQPITLPYGGTYVPEGAGTTYTPTDTPDGNENPIPSSALDPMTGSPDAVAPQPIGLYGIYYVSYLGAVATTDFTQLNNVIYTIEIEGTANLGSTNAGVLYNYKASNANLVIAAGTYVNGTGITFLASIFSTNWSCNITQTLGGTTTVASVKITHVRYTGLGFGASAAVTIQLLSSTDTVLASQSTQQAAFVSGQEVTQTINFTTPVTNVAKIKVIETHNWTASQPRITAMEYFSDVLGPNGEADAFYYGFGNGGTATRFAVGQGLVTWNGIANIAFPVIPPYNDTHRYTMQVIGDNSLTGLRFRYALSSYTGVEARFLQLKIKFSI
jgi:hypothetical protein